MNASAEFRFLRNLRQQKGGLSRFLHAILHSVRKRLFDPFDATSSAPSFSSFIKWQEKREAFKIASAVGKGQDRKGSKSANGRLSLIKRVESIDR